jgi:leader peptidase (prepilin peptidase)/N-methyltransferase
MIRMMGTIFAGLLGLAFGSFLNVCLSRWPEGESIVQPRSHCRRCTHTLAWWENIPLLSWLALRGRCRNCRAWVGWRYPLVEFAVGALWALEAWRLVGTMSLPDAPPAGAVLAEMLGRMIFYWLLVALAILDMENLWLPHWITLPGTVIGFISALLQFEFSPDLGSFLVFWSLGTTGLQHPGFTRFALIRLLGILTAAGLILLIRWVYWLLRRREGIGLGDAKLMALLAAWLGLPGALVAFVLGIVLGALTAVALLAIPAARKQSASWSMSKLPLGTFLCVGGVVSSLWGQQILAAYLRWAGL